MLPSCNSMAFGRAPPRGGALPYWLKGRPADRPWAVGTPPPEGALLNPPHLVRRLPLLGLSPRGIGVSYFKSCLGLIVDERKFIHDKPENNGGSPLMGLHVF